MEAELVRMDDYVGMIQWIRNFLLKKRFSVNDNILHQDNQCAILLSKNGRLSNSKRMTHIKVCDFYIKDKVERKEIDIK